jgi:hypothetical protein
MLNSNTNQIEMSHDCQTYAKMKECKRVINRMFKKLQKSLLNIEIHATVYIIQKDMDEVAKYKGSTYSGTDLRYDFYDMYLHRENAIKDVGAYRSIDDDLETLIVDPYFDFDYVDKLEFVTEIYNQKEHTAVRKFIYYSYPPDHPEFKYIVIMPRETYNYTFYRRLLANSCKEVSDAYELLGQFRGMTKGSKKYKKILNRLNQKMSFIFYNTIDERVAFENEIREHNFYRREWL